LHYSLSTGCPANMNADAIVATSLAPVQVVKTIANPAAPTTHLSVGRLLPASLPPSLTGVKSAVMEQQSSSCMIARSYEFPSVAALKVARSNNY
jgi:hypothetical protein